MFGSGVIRKRTRFYTGKPSLMFEICVLFTLLVTIKVYQSNREFQSLRHAMDMINKWLCCCSTPCTFSYYWVFTFLLQTCFCLVFFPRCRLRYSTPLTCQVASTPLKKHSALCLYLASLFLVWTVLKKSEFFSKFFLN